jgi:signal recognition particle subunit SRP54
MSQIPAAMKNQFDDSIFKRYVAIINSMTPKERRFPDFIKGSHKRRIAAGSGTEIQAINQLLKQFMTMQKMMKKASGGGMMKMMRGLQGKIPPGVMPW